MLPFLCEYSNEKETEVRVCQHLMASSKSLQRKPFGECKLLKKAGCLKKSRNSEISNLKLLPELAGIYSSNEDCMTAYVSVHTSTYSPSYTSITTLSSLPQKKYFYSLTSMFYFN